MGVAVTICVRLISYAATAAIYPSFTSTPRSANASQGAYIFRRYRAPGVLHFFQVHK